MSFQKVVNAHQAPAVAGDFASVNPHASLLAGEGTLVAGADGVTVGTFAWADDNGVVTNTKPSSGRVGFVHREQQAGITQHLAEHGNTILAGSAMTLMSGGDFWARFADGANIGQKVFAGDLDEYVKNLKGQKFNVFVADPYRELRGQAAENNTTPMFGTADWQRKLQAKEMVSGASTKLEALSRKYGLPPELLYSVWTQESMKGNLKKASSAGAKGHFQFMPKTAAEFGIAGKEWDFDISAEAAARKYRGLLKMYQGDVDKALAAYNYGEGNVNKKVRLHGSDWLKNTPKETQTYVGNIRSMMQHRRPVIAAGTPVGGAAVSGSLNRNVPQMANLKQPQSTHNHTEVVVQNVNVQTSAHTMTGTGADMVKGIAQHANQFNNGLI